VTRFTKFWNDDSGPGLPEYALLVAGIAVMAVIVSALFSEQVRALLGSIGSYIQSNDGLP
jgi:Flp pilus assembly pilin Flp